MRLVSRKGNTFKTFPDLAAGLGAALPARNAVIDGEIVYVGPDGVPRFYDLMRRRRPQHYFAFDLLWLNGRDLRGLPLLERKRLLRGIIPAQPCPVRYVNHLTATGVPLFQAVCERDLEDVVAKLGNAPYTPDEPTWVKITNRSYSQAEERADFSDERKLCASV